MFQDLYNWAKEIIKQDVGMKFYEACKPLHLETDVLTISPEVRLLQVSDCVNCGCDEVQDNITLCPKLFLLANTY